jgi:hypothetical protein
LCGAWGAGRGYTLAGVGVVAAAVIAISFLSWLAPDSDRPIRNPLEVVVEQIVALIEERTGETFEFDEQLTATGSKLHPEVVTPSFELDYFNSENEEMKIARGHPGTQPFYSKFSLRFTRL